MIYVLARKIDLGRYVEVNNLLQKHSTEKAVRIGWKMLGEIKPTEKLYISAHGDLHTVEGRTPDQLAKELVADGLTKQIQLKGIKLLSCKGGKAGPNLAPYAQRLADALVQEGGPTVTVVGYDGETTVMDRGGRLWAKNVRLADYAEYNEFQTKHLPAFSALSAKARNKACDTPQRLRTLAANYAIHTEAIFEWLYKTNDLYVEKIPNNDPLKPNKSFKTPKFRSA